ncbi:MAG: hypothetical protein K2Y01_05155 [Rhabdochlamydiaceae bacterium]|nr:hypothetical protein [Rhabdochlamydiaceae bacterium]
MSTDAINGTPNSLFDICKHDITGICTSTTESVKSFFASAQTWGQNCSGKIQEQYFNGTAKDPSNTSNPAYDTCIGPETTIGKVAAVVSTMATTAAPWIKTSLPTIFSLLQLPELPKDVTSGKTAEGPWPAAALAASVIIPYFLSSKMPAISSLSSGGLIGAGVSLLFGQDPQMGALAGAVSKLAIDTIGNYVGAPFKKMYASAEKTLKPYIRIANTIMTAALVVGVGYHFNTLTTLATNNPWIAFATVMAAGSQFQLLWKLYQMKGALSLATSLVSFCISHIHYPVVAYLSLAAQSPELQTHIVTKFAEAPVAYAGAGLLVTMLGYSLFKGAPTIPTAATKKDLNIQRPSEQTKLPIYANTGTRSDRSSESINATRRSRSRSPTTGSRSRSPNSKAVARPYSGTKLL